MICFTELDANRPHYFKEQLGYLSIAVEEAAKPPPKVVNRREGKILDKTADMLAFLQDLGRPFSAKDLAEEYGISVKKGGKYLANWVMNPATYGVEISHYANKIRYCKFIE